jgi:hypothetical protein
MMGQPFGTQNQLIQPNMGIPMPMNPMQYQLIDPNTGFALQPPMNPDI